MNADWFYSVGEDRQGPVTEAELKRLVADGKLRPDDLVWKDGMPDWVEARTVATLFPKAAPVAAQEDDRPSGARRRFDRGFDRDGEDDDRPRSRRRFDDDRSRSRRDEDDDDDRPRVRRRRDDDDDYDDRPRRRGSKIPSDVQSTKMAAGLLAIFLGWLGIHKFYLGYNGAGAIYITITAVSWILMFISCGILFFLPMIPSIMALIEGIIYLTKTDRDFYETYMRGQKDWF
ncbi:MAG TPA: GYF domain-containing protein [Gemmataceae bacterium]|nr:GYF domain-containing protein [Gemmataceae bacterium]